MNNNVNPKEQARMFDDILNRAENGHCADCNAKGPNWYSLAFGCFVCIKCSGKNRN